MLHYLIKQFRIRRQNRTRLHALGNHTQIAETAIFVRHEQISIGAYCRIGHQCKLEGKGGITIGDGTILAPEVLILSSTHQYSQQEWLPYNEVDHARPVTIGRGVWIGYRALIVPGVRIEDAAVIAAGAVVTKDVGKGEIVGGNPAKRIRVREDLDWIERAIAEQRYYLAGRQQQGMQRRYEPDERSANASVPSARQPQ